MQIRTGLMVVVHGLVMLFAMGNIVSAQDHKLKKDRWNITKDVGLIIIGTARGSPIAALVGTTRLGIDTIKYQKHKNQAEVAQQTTTNAPVPGQVESLVPVPKKPGYYYYPSNPNQLYVDQARAVVADPMQARIDPVEATTKSLMTVRIANTAKDGLPITCTVDGMTFSVPPGFTQTLSAVPGAVISFDRGDRPGVERYTLSEGSYEFRSVDDGWRFYNQNTARTVASGTGSTTPSATPPPQGASVPRVGDRR